MARETADRRDPEAVLAYPPVPPDATLPYGELPDQIVDFFTPRGGEGPAPLVVLFHGGAWRAPYDRQHISPLAAHLAAHGFAVASVEYRRGPAPEQHGGGRRAAPATGAAVGGGAPVVADAPGVTVDHPAGRWPETLDDVALAVDRIPAMVAELAAAAPGVRGASPYAYGEAAGSEVRTDSPHGGASAEARPGLHRWGSVDTGRLVLSGHSAGGHLALWAAARHRQPSGSRWHWAARPPVSGVVALAPIADFATSRELDVCSDAVVQLLGGPAGYASRRAYADPVALLPTGIPTTIVHGAVDDVVPPQVARAFATEAERAGERVRLVLLDGAGHFPLIDPYCPEAGVVIGELRRLTG
ncbi:alpha/beta hydrolase [Streptomyces sp. NPDC051776]|uniref:alpha/beta hydrolase n=1 Tax=Streptomyces sp. NPDC051776 TaxID=3155414 RepID=UPI00342F5CC4